jgi:hypothetical protein
MKMRRDIGLITRSNIYLENMDVKSEKMENDKLNFKHIS